MQGAPLTPREVRIIEYLHTVQDMFFRYGDWPEYLQRMMLKPHKNNRERFTMFFFLTGNGLDPEAAGLWTLLLDVRPGLAGILRPIPGAYDEAAHKQIEQMKQQLANGTLFKGTKDMMDLAAGYVKKM